MEPLAVEILGHVRRQESAAVHRGDNLAHQAADQHPLAVGHRIERRDQARCAHTAQAAGGFHEQYLRAQPRGTHGRCRTRRPAAGDNQVETSLGRNFPRKAIGRLRAGWRTLGRRCCRRLAQPCDAGRADCG